MGDIVSKSGSLQFKNDTIYFPKTLRGDTVYLKYDFTAISPETFKIEDEKPVATAQFPDTIPTEYSKKAIPEA